MNYNYIGNDGAASIATSLADIPTLTNLELWHNQISDAGATSIANVLHTASLTLLDLSENRIGDTGAESIAAVLTQILY